MARLSRVLSGEDGYASFWCPGCDSLHTVRIDGSQYAWGYNDDPDKPTFTPSVKVTWPANPNATEEFKEWRTERICHSFVTDGRIHFLTDSSHSLAGTTVDLPEFPEDWI